MITESKRISYLVEHITREILDVLDTRHWAKNLVSLKKYQTIITLKLSLDFLWGTKLLYFLGHL